MVVLVSALTHIVLIGWLWVSLAVTVIIIAVWLGALQVKAT